MGSSSDSLLCWCLEKQKIPEHAYLKWAQALYGLPILKEDYFGSALGKVRFDLDSHGPWKAHLFPVGQWEEVLFLACVEPPTELKINKDYQLVLAAWSHLRPCWEQRHPDTRKEESVSTSKRAVSHAFKELDLPPVPESSHLKLETFEVEKPEERTLAVETTLTPLPKNKLSHYERTLLDIDQVLNSIRVYFDKVIVFRFKSSSLFPMKWDDSWKPLGDPSSLRVKVDSPSIFRTCVTSLHPYHGRIVPNAVNTQFFNNWNGSQIPVHATLVPVIKEKKVIALVMGIKHTAMDHSERVLRDSEEVARKIGHLLVANGLGEAA